MKAEEFRIGNFIDFLGLKRVVGMSFTAAGKFKIEVEHKRPNGFSWREYVFMDSLELNPIPLTEEWLKKFGLKYQGYVNGDQEEYYEYSMSELRFWNSEHDESHWKFSFGLNDEFDVKLHHVHQFQNLYFALTGEELTLIEKP